MAGELVDAVFVVWTDVGTMGSSMGADNSMIISFDPLKNVELFVFIRFLPETTRESSHISGI